MRPFDPDTYLKEVLGPFLGSSERPGLFEVYCLDAEDDDDEVIEARLAEVRALWNKSSEHPKYGKLVRGLIEKHGEAELTLGDRAERSRVAAETASRHQQQADEAKQKTEAWKRTLDAWVDTRGGLDPARRAQLEEIAKRAGIDDSFARSRLDAAPVAAPPPVLDEQKRSKVRKDLRALAQGLDEPRLGLTLFHALGLAGITQDGGEVQDAYAQAAKANSGRGHGNVQDLYKFVLGHAKTLLLDADPRAYIEGLVLDVQEQMAGEGSQAAATGDEIDEVEALQLTERAQKLGLTPELARRVVTEIAKANNVPLRMGAEVSYVSCPRCNVPHRRGDGHEHCIACDAALYVTCPKEDCRATNDATAGRCVECRSDLRGYADALRLAAGAASLAKAGRLREAVGNLETALATLGDSPEATAQLAPLEAKLDEARGAWRLVESAIEDRRLYAARQALRELRGSAADVPGADGAVPAERLQFVNERIREAEAALAEARRASGPEREAALVRALSLASDCGEASQELERIPPASPGAVRAVSDDQSVLVEWDPSPTPGVEYRVSRTSAGGSGSTPIATTGALRVEDTSVEAGAHVRYAVEAVRGRSSSGAVRSDALVVLSEVDDLTASDGDGEVMLRWKRSGSAGRVVLTRCEERGAEQTLVPDPSGYHDREVVNGRRYTYLVRLEYPGLEERKLLTAGRSVYGQPAARPDPVTLAAEARGDGVQLAYDPPAVGTVTVVRCQHEPAIEPGSEIAAGALAQYGEALPADLSGARDDGAGGTGLRWYLPVTVSGGIGVTGPALRHLALPALTGVEAVLAGSAVRVTWEWPEGVRIATVVWRHDRQPSGPDDPEARRLHVRQAQYRDGGGVTLETTGSEPLFVAVFSAARIDGDVITGAAAPKSARATVRATTKTDVHYTVRQAGLLKRRLEVSASASGGDLPSLVFVARPGDILPRNPADGDVIARLGGEEPADRSVELAGRRRPLAVRMFLDSMSATASHRLFDPAAEELLIR